MTLPAPDVQEAIRVLRDAADTLRSKGWCQGQFSDDHGSFCMTGALNVVLTGNPHRASGNTPEKENLYYRITTLLSARLGPGTNIVTWNDTPGRIVQEVVDELLGAALALESGTPLPESFWRVKR